MAETALVESFISDASALVKKLDEGATAVSFAAWYYQDDAERWQLLLASPALDPLIRQSQALAYGRVIEALNQLSTAALSVSDIKIVATDSKLKVALGMMVRTSAHSITRVHCQSNMVNGIFISEAIVLRSA